MYCTVHYCTVLHCTVLYCTQAWPLDTEDTDVPWRVRRLDLSWCGLTRLPSMLPTSYSDWATLTRYCTVLYCTVLYCTVLPHQPRPAAQPLAVRLPRPVAAGRPRARHVQQHPGHAAR